MTRPLIRVLVADPHPIMRRGVNALLATHECYVVVGHAAEAAEAVRLAEELDPTVAIIAYGFPDLNGVELAQQLRSVAPRTGLVMYTNVAAEGVLLAALDAGIKAFVLKSDADSNLVAALDAVCLNRPYFSESVSRSLLERLRMPGLSHRCVTPREREVVQLLANGCTNRQVARLIEVSIKTVETHRAHVMEKLDLRTTADLVRFAIRNDLVQV